MAQQSSLKANADALDSDQKRLQVVSERFTTHFSKEFSIRPYDGLLIAAHKDVFKHVTPEDSLNYELTSFGPGRNVGSGLLKYMTPGYVTPLFPIDVELTNDNRPSVDFSSGLRFMDKVIILSGAHHVDKTEEFIEGAHDYDDIISSMAKALREKEIDTNNMRYASSAGANVLDATSQESLDPSHADKLYDTFFSEIDVSERKDHVLYMTCHAKAAIDYVLSNLDILQPPDKMYVYKDCGLRVMPEKIMVEVNNERLSPTPVHCRWLVTNSNILLKPEAVPQLYGEGMYVKDNLLEEFNRVMATVSRPPEDCLLLPALKFLVSELASNVLLEYPTPIKDTYREDLRGSTALASRLNLTTQMYFREKQKPVPGVTSADHLTHLCLAALKNGYSPVALMYYRTDNPDSELLKTTLPWPKPLSQYIVENIRKACNDRSEEENVKDYIRKEVMCMTPFQMMKLLSYRDDIFNVDVFHNAVELHRENTNGTGKPAKGDTMTTPKNSKLKATCGRNIIKGTFGIVQHVFSKFHYDPMAFKRMFVINALHTIGGKRNACLHPDISCSPYPSCPKVIKTTAAAKEKVNYMCTKCGTIPFYQRDGTHCLCFLLLKAYGELKRDRSSTVADLRSLHNRLQNIDDLKYNFEKTCYKTVHSFTVNETRSASGHFGKIAIRHQGRVNGFKGRKKANQSEQVGNDSLSESTNVVGNDNKDMQDAVIVIGDNKDPTSTYQETKQMSWLVKNVKAKLKREGTLAEPEKPMSEEELKASFLYDKQYLWVRSDGVRGNKVEPQDLRTFVTGTPDDCDNRLRNALLSDVTPIIPLMKKDPSPAMLRPKKSLESDYMSIPAPTNSRNNRKHDANDGWEVDDDDDDDDDDDGDDNNNNNVTNETQKKEVEIQEDDEHNDNSDHTAELNVAHREANGEPKKKRIKKSERTDQKKRSGGENESRKRMHDFVRSLLYKVVTDQSIGDNVQISDFSVPFARLLTKWKKNPAVKRAQFELAVYKILFGYEASDKEMMNMDDQNSIVAKIMTSYLKRISVFISNVHTAVAELLDMTPEELDTDHSQIVHHGERTKKEYLSWIDLHGSDSLNNRSNMLSSYEIIRHTLESRSCILASELQPKEDNVKTQLADKNGPYAELVEGTAKIHVPILRRNNEQVQLTVSGNPVNDVTVNYSMYLPMKLKIALDATEFANIESTVSHSSSTVETVDTETDYYNGHGADSIFVPRHLLNTNSSVLSSPENTVKSHEELAAILRDDNLKFTRVGTPQFMDITKKNDLIEIVSRYITSRKAPTLGDDHNLVMHEFFSMIKKGLLSVLEKMKCAVVMLAKYVDIDKDLFDGTFQGVVHLLLTDVGVSRIFQAVARNDVTLASSLYILMLGSELYSPATQMKHGVDELERDNHALSTIIATCLRLFIGTDDCNTTVRKAESKQRRLKSTVTSYFGDRGKTFTTSTDVARPQASQLMMLMNMSSYTSTHGNSTVYTSGRGGGSVSVNVAPVLHSILKTSSGGQHNHVACVPLVKVTNRVLEKTVNIIASLIETMTLNSFVTYALKNVSNNHARFSNLLHTVASKSTQRVYRRRGLRKLPESSSGRRV